MKQCPKCNKQFTDAWMSFCPDDGGILTEAIVSTFGRADTPPASSNDPTVMFRTPVEPGSWAQPDVYTPPPVPKPAQPYTPPTPAWQPPPPPPYVKSPNQGLAVASMITGVLGMVFGVLCFGPVIGIVAVVLGIISLSQQKKTPQYVGGKPFAIIGIVTGGISLLFYGGIVLFAIVASILG